MAFQLTAVEKPVPLTADQRRIARAARKAERTAAIHGRVVESENSSNAVDLAFPKGPSRDQLKADAHKAEVKQIRKTHDKLWKLTQCCAVCSDTERETAQKCADARHQMHEDPARSLTRGLPPAERFNIYICGRVCPLCHPKLTEHVWRVSFHDEVKRWRGDYDVIDVASGHVLAHMRRGELSRPSLPGDSE